MAHDGLPSWQVGGKEFSSRLIVGSGGMVSLDSLGECIEVSGCQIVTVSIRRAGRGTGAGSLIDVLTQRGMTLLPNTAGSLTPADAVFTAHMAREALGTSWVKLEVISDVITNLPDTRGVLLAAEKLVDDGFEVFAYTNDDPVVARHLAKMGCAAVMPGGSPIGTGLGVINPYNIRTIVEEATVPIIVDAGLGTASDAAVAMELGASAILLATAIHGATHPPMMARAFAYATEAGALAYRAGRIPARGTSVPSSPAPDYTVPSSH